MIETLLSLAANNPLIALGLVVLVLAIIWTALRFVFRLAMRVFTTGCAIIVIIGLLFLLFRYFTS